jgi:hypothetical protein
MKRIEIYKIKKHKIFIIINFDIIIDMIILFINYYIHNIYNTRTDMNKNC